jgi:hypothetical protein
MERVNLLSSVLQLDSHALVLALYRKDIAQDYSTGQDGFEVKRLLTSGLAFQYIDCQLFIMNDNKLI